MKIMKCIILNIKIRINKKAKGYLNILLNGNDHDDNL